MCMRSPWHRHESSISLNFEKLKHHMRNGENNSHCFTLHTLCSVLCSHSLASTHTEHGDSVRFGGVSLGFMEFLGIYWANNQEYTIHFQWLEWSLWQLLVLWRWKGPGPHNTGKCQPAFWKSNSPLLPVDRSGQNTYVCTWVASLCCSTGHPPDTQQWPADWHPAWSLHYIRMSLYCPKWTHCPWMSHFLEPLEFRRTQLKK